MLEFQPGKWKPRYSFTNARNYAKIKTHMAYMNLKSFELKTTGLFRYTLFLL